MSTRVLIADDHGIIRQGLRSLLEKEPDIQVVAEARDGKQAVSLAERFQPDVVIMDITMPNLNGISAARQISSANDIKVIALSIHSNQRFISDMLKAGASGYDLKECVFDELLRAVRTVAAGDVYLSPRIAGTIVGSFLKHLSAEGQPKSAELTDRQRQILQLLAEGKTTKKIAIQLHLSNKTIEADRRNIMKKLDIHTIAELTKYAVRKGLTSLNF